MKIPLKIKACLKITVAIFVSAFTLIGCGGGASKGFAPPPTPVETVGVRQTTVSDKFEAVGSMEAEDAITVVSEIDAAIISLPFAEGQSIAEGGLIAKLDDKQIAAEVKSAEATRDQAQVTYDRIKQIVDAGAAAKQELDDAIASLKVAEARLEEASVRLSKTKITAPFSGILGARQVSPGAFLRAGSPITTLTKISSLKVSFAVPERIFSKFTDGSTVTISPPAYPGYELTGKITVIDPVVDEATRNAQIIARVENPDRKLRPGMSASVTAILSERPNALTVPDEAVFAEGNQSFVYVVKPDSTVTRAAITLGARQSGTVEVIKGLSPGLTVISAGHQKLYEGAKVMPVTEENPDKAQKTGNDSGGNG